MKRLWKGVRHRVLKVWLPSFGVGVAAFLIRCIGVTLRVRVADPDGILASPPAGAILFAFWHNRILMMPYLYNKLLPGRKLAVMISNSRDGQFITEVAGRFGIAGTRGSSSRGGGTALRQMARMLESGESDVAITPDGPRGPVYRVQSGVVKLALQTGMPVVPVRCEYDSCWRMKSWDRFIIPKPFSRCHLVVGPARTVNSDDYEKEGAALAAAMAGPGDSSG